MSVSKYESQRKILNDNLKDTNTFSNTDLTKTFLDLMTNDNKNAIKAVGIYIQDCSIT